MAHGMAWQFKQAHMAMSKPDSMRIWGVQFAMFPWCMQILLLIFCWKWNKDKVRVEKRKGKRSGKEGDCFFGWACQPVRLERPKGEILCSLLFSLAESKEGCKRVVSDNQWHMCGVLSFGDRTTYWGVRSSISLK